MTPPTKLHWMLGVSILLFNVAGLRAQDSDGDWSKAGGGSWANANNWDSQIIADGEDNTAYFGLSLEPPIPATATFTLDGARSIGNIEFLAQSGPDNWALNTGSGGPLTLDYTFGVPSIDVSYSSETVTINLVLAGTNGMEKDGVGTLVLSGANTYTGETLVSAGTLVVNGTISDAVTVAAGVLGGNGLIIGPVTVQSGGTLAPGNPTNSLTITNSLTLQSGSTTLIALNASTLACNVVNGISAAAYAGTLVVSNTAGTPVLGQSYAIFSAAGASGNFSSIKPQLTGGLRWRFNPAAGVLSVVSASSQPWFASVVPTGGGAVVMSVTNGAPGVTNYLLGSANLSLPLTNWTRLATNVFDPGGDCLITNPMAANIQFYSIAAPAGP